jgi:PTH1 family peptidyl-tRNA hydrolase
MYLIAGLGNPGSQYEKTRHNVGFMVLDHMADGSNLTYSESKWKALTVKTVFWDNPAVLMKPLTFMNVSGYAVSAAANFYKLQTENIIVVHDDLDMAVGRVKIMSGGGDGGHKGVRSCIEHLGTRDFTRIKVGIGRPESPISPEKYVLGKFDAEQNQLIGQKLTTVVEAVKIILQEDVAAAMNIVNQKE